MHVFICGLIYVFRWFNLEQLKVFNSKQDLILGLNILGRVAQDRKAVYREWKYLLSCVWERGMEPNIQLSKG